MALTLRITDEEIVELEKLKNYLNIRSSSKIISYLIADYIDKDAVLNDTKKKLADTDRRLKSLLSLVRDKHETETKILDLVYQSGCKSQG